MLQKDEIKMTRIEELERIAKAATPGPWRHIPGDSYCAYSHVICGNKTQVVEDHDGHDPGECRKNGECGMPDDDADAAHIAAFDPLTVLALIADWKRMKEAMKDTIARADDLGDSYTSAPLRDCVRTLKMEKGEV